MQQRFRIRAVSHDAAAKPPTELVGNWDIAVMGAVDDLDARSKAACEVAAAAAKAASTLRFEQVTGEIWLDGTIVSFGRLCALLRGKKSVLIEATTLTFPEILYTAAAAFREKVTQVRLVYVEPIEYRREGVEGRLWEHRGFTLSDNRRFQGIPMFRVDLNDVSAGQAVFFLGYEGERLGQALEQQEMLQRWKRRVVFGVPAFEAGWEIDAMANNIQYLSEKDQVLYAEASSARSAYRLLSKLRHEDKEAEPILVAPLGTKPHAIGAALFLIEHNSMDQAMLLYDHPVRSQGRSVDIRRWHFYDVHDSN